jgi:hypothetical protein
VLKSLSRKPCENVAISRCVVSSHCNAIKLGTESGGDRPTRRRACGRRGRRDSVHASPRRGRPWLPPPGNGHAVSQAGRASQPARLPDRERSPPSPGRGRDRPGRACGRLIRERRHNRACSVVTRAAWGVAIAPAASPSGRVSPGRGGRSR